MYLSDQVHTSQEVSFFKFFKTTCIGLMISHMNYFVLNYYVELQYAWYLIIIINISSYIN